MKWNVTPRTAAGEISKAGGELCAAVGSVGQEVARTQTFNHQTRRERGCLRKQRQVRESCDGGHED